MPAMPSTLSDLERRAWRYDSQDGILELLAGFLFLLVARTVVDPHLTWMLALVIFPMRFAARIMKERFAYPRVGYVKLRGEEGSEVGRGMLTYLAGVVLSVALVLLLLGDLTSGAAWMQWMPAIAAGFTSGGFIYLAQRSGLWRFRILAAVCVGWGVLCASWLQAPGMLGVRRWALGFGTLLLLVGGATFANFLRTHPIRDAEAPHGTA